MDVHHVPDKYAMSSLIRNYDSEDAPAIALPKAQHRKMPPLSVRKRIRTGYCTDLLP